MKIVAIIQARMGSTRLPEKVMQDICGKPMLWHVVQRAASVRSIDEVVIATSDKTQDDAIANFCQEYGIMCYRGSEMDVLDRYYQCARKYKADVVVRITSDCPLLDPQVTEKVIATYQNSSTELDGAFNTLERTYPRGLDTEVVPFQTLAHCWQQKKSAFDREHVFTIIYKNLANYRIASVTNERDESHLRWTVDEQKDLEFVRQVYQYLYKEDAIFDAKVIKDLLEAETGLSNINKDVQQKTLKSI